jgi:hypothetical protein
MRSTLLTILALTLGSVVFLAQDFSRCANDLEALHRKADDASRAAASARSAADHFRVAKSIFEVCREGARKNSCRDESSAVEAADSYLQLARLKLDSALNDVSRAVRDVQTSCGMREARPASGELSLDQAMCSSFRSTKYLSGVEETMTQCKKYMSETDCKACLATPKE